MALAADGHGAGDVFLAQGINADAGYVGEAGRDVERGQVVGHVVVGRHVVARQGADGRVQYVVRSRGILGSRLLGKDHRVKVGVGPRQVDCLGFSLAEDDVDEGCDIGYGDGAVVVDISQMVFTTAVLTEEDVDEGSDVGNGDGAVVVDIANGVGKRQLLNLHIVDKQLRRSGRTHVGTRIAEVDFAAGGCRQVQIDDRFGPLTAGEIGLGIVAGAVVADEAHGACVVGWGVVASVVDLERKAIEAFGQRNCLAVAHAVGPAGSQSQCSACAVAVGIGGRHYIGSSRETIARTESEGTARLRVARGIGSPCRHGLATAHWAVFGIGVDDGADEVALHVEAGIGEVEAGDIGLGCG